MANSLEGPATTPRTRRKKGNPKPPAKRKAATKKRPAKKRPAKKAAAPKATKKKRPTSKGTKKGTTKARKPAAGDRRKKAQRRRGGRGAKTTPKATPKTPEQIAADSPLFNDASTIKEDTELLAKARDRRWETNRDVMQALVAKAGRMALQTTSVRDFSRLFREVRACEGQNQSDELKGVPDQVTVTTTVTMTPAVQRAAILNAVAAELSKREITLEEDE